MRITDLLSKDAVVLRAKVSNKEEAFDMLIDLHEKIGSITNKKLYKEDIMKREAQGPTAIGDGIAIPHAKSSAVKKPMLTAITVPDGVDLNALDQQPSKLIFMIAAPEGGGDTHLELLSRLTVMLMDASFREELLAAQNTDAFLKIIDRKETEKYGHEEPVQKKDGYRILAVTACPTGIAHTFMAAEALTNKAAEMGINLKAETNGSGGAKNVLTRQEIEQADAIIIAADKNVEMARFDGKRVIKTSVSEGIHKPEELIKRALSGDAPVYHHNGAKTEERYSGDESFGRKIYKHLMNGVSHMLPFVVGGGILIALAFLLDDYAIDPSNFGKNTPLAAFFKTLGDTAFGFMLPILAGYIAMSIADRPGLAVGFVGGALAVSGMTFLNPDGGISAGFLGALFAGFVGGYIVVGLRKIFSKLPDSLEGIKPVLLYPLLGVLLIGVVMCAVNPLIAMLNEALNNGLRSMGTTSKVLLGIVLGGMMSIDMGGPFNKAAYVFGTASIASGEYDIMAAVMIGGMIPPLAIALCSTFFKNRFTPAERQSGLVNYILGLCFISEGAIPFAAADPLRVIPSCIVGSAVAGGLSMLFGCTLMAPHGGIFVFPVVGNWPMYLLALVIGSVVGCIMLAFLKKPVQK
ncbi:MAG TPA: PTS sugar transporter subunit IIA [Candidatus Avimonoglobus intestinipullorum]|uniref:PTS sugar transporter subunit IIA n=1 Tax=Candidatus Avimonoglobus intestinipullorum TaxID=2840699 RepID=A0A9D1LUS7_9FIRM|nr:PTS sugar transporter subunit IIA [Candidatus Avimonoglobus intestinipullorum]